MLNIYDLFINCLSCKESSKFGAIDEDRSVEVTSQEVVAMTSEERTIGSTMATGTSSDPWRQVSTEQAQRETVRDPVTSGEPTTEREVPTSLEPTQEQTETMELLQPRSMF